MKLTELLEQDKEKLISALEQAGTPERAVPVLESEIDHLAAAGAGELSGETSLASLSRIMRTVRMAMRLADTAGEIRCWERSASAREQSGIGKSKAAVRVIVLLAAGLFFLGGGLFFQSGMIGKAPSLPALVLMAAGAALCLAAGFFAGTGRAVRTKKEQKFEQLIDAAKMYRCLHSVMVVADQCLMEASSDDAAGEKRLKGEAAARISEAEAGLYAGLFEASYSGDGEYMKERIEELRFYLHTRGIEVVDDSDEHAAWFDRMPSSKRGTLRPALVADGTVIKRGLAAYDVQAGK